MPRVWLLYLLSIVAASAADWQTCNDIVANLHTPTFPDRRFAITDYGAAPGGKDCTGAIRQAIDACVAAGGGHVIVPAGEFFTGAIHLRSNVDLHLDTGATLKFNPDPAAYLPVVRVRWEGIECMNYSPLIYAFEQHNIAVTGHGTLDGSASETVWWDWARHSKGHPSRSGPDSRRLEELANQQVPAEQRIFGAGHLLRPNFFVPYRCRDVMIEGVTFHNSPMWEVNPVLCTNVIVRGVTIDTLGPNNDGCDPDSSHNVLIEGCRFRTGDDCIAIKSGRNADGRKLGVAAENIVVRNCEMQDGHGGVVIGSEISGGCRNVFVENCVMNSPTLDRVLRFKSNAQRGGTIENVFARHLKIGQVVEAIVTVDFMYEEGAKGPLSPVLRHVVVEDVISEHTPRVLYVASFPKADVDDLHFEHCVFQGLEHSDVVNYARHITFDDVKLSPLHPVGSRNSRAPTAD